MPQALAAGAARDKDTPAAQQVYTQRWFAPLPAQAACKVPSTRWPIFAGVVAGPNPNPLSVTAACTTLV